MTEARLAAVVRRLWRQGDWRSAVAWTRGADARSRLTPAAVAAALGVSRSTAARLLAVAREPSYDPLTSLPLAYYVAALAARRLWPDDPIRGTPATWIAWAYTHDWPLGTLRWALRHPDQLPRRAQAATRARRRLETAAARYNTRHGAWGGRVTVTASSPTCSR